MDYPRLIASVLLPPLGVFMAEGWSRRFWVNTGLTTLGYVPGVVHALSVTTRR